MLSKGWKLVVISWLAFLPAGWGNTLLLFEKANMMYDSSEYEKAYFLYDSIEKMQLKSAELYYNKGNCAYKLGWTALSILNYERALKQNPGLDDALHNLMLANEQVADKRSDTRQKGILVWISAFFGGNYQLFATITLFAMAMFGVFGTVYLSKKIAKQWFFRLAVLSLLTGLLSLALTVVLTQAGKQMNEAILMDPVITIYNEPSENSSAAFILHEGSRVELMEEIELWYKVRFDAKVGWVQKKGVEKI
jgi:tetratricopeptide (TPR) repeat protein